VEKQKQFQFIAYREPSLSGAPKGILVCSCLADSQGWDRLGWEEQRAECSDEMPSAGHLGVQDWASVPEALISWETMEGSCG
jgi:hypothetical protein